MFIRLKKIKNNQYAYLVENTWKKRKQSSRQQVKAYLGRVLPAPHQKITMSSINIQEKEYSLALLSILQSQLLQYGFQEKNGKLQYEDIIIDLNNKTVTREGKDVVLKMHDGYLCSHSIKKALQFQGEGYEEQVGLQLAETLVGVGLDLPQEMFIQLFEKIYRAPKED